MKAGIAFFVARASGLEGMGREPVMVLVNLPMPDLEAGMRQRI